MSEATPVLEARNLEVGYGSLPVIYDLNLSVQPREVVALLGANGAGKSTTLLALAGELPLSRGEVLMDGVKVTAPLHVRVRRGLAFVPEERSVLRTLSCADNLRLGMANHRTSLKIFPELEKRMSVRGGLLSGGEQQMVSLGRALSLEPRVLLADELSLGLAPQTVKKLLVTVRRAADEGCGVLLVEQHVRLALSIADRAYVLHRGKVVAAGKRDEIIGQIGEIEQRYLGGAVARKHLSEVE